MHSTVVVTKKKNSTYFTDSEKKDKKDNRMFTSNINNNTNNIAEINLFILTSHYDEDKQKMILEIKKSQVSFSFFLFFRQK